MTTGMGNTTTNQIDFEKFAHRNQVVYPEDQKFSLSNWLILGGLALLVLMLMSGGRGGRE